MVLGCGKVALSVLKVSTNLAEHQLVMVCVCVCVCVYIFGYTVCVSINVIQEKQVSRSMSTELLGQFACSEKVLNQ